MAEQIQTEIDEINNNKLAQLEDELNFARCDAVEEEPIQQTEVV